MKKKLIALAIWIFVSVLYCLNIADIGRSIGAITNGAIEKYADMRTEYGETVSLDEFGDAASDSFSYHYFYDLDSDFKFDFTVISITTVIYISVSIGCYHMGTKGQKPIPKNEDVIKED